jgi:hypothetical protein
MKNRKKRIFLSLALIITASLSSITFLFNSGDFKFLETSVLSVLKDIASENAPEPADIAIDDISIRKVSDPKEDFNYYKYRATIFLRNDGGNLRNARVIIHAGDNQKHTLIKNTDAGFTLLKDETYIIRDYELLFDGNYNGGKVPIWIEVVDKADSYAENNFFILDVFDDNARIKSLKIEEILNDGTFVLDFNSIPFSIRKHEFELFVGDSAVYEEKDLRYDEVYTLDESYGYFKTKNSLANLAHTGYSSSQVSEIDSHFVELSYDPFSDENTHYVYLKTTNPETGYYAISNILMLPSQESITKAEFSKLFIEYTDEEVFDFGDIYYEDVPENEWYTPYVKTLFNLGFFDASNFKFSPDSKITRGEVLKLVMDYYDVDLVVGAKSEHFDDVFEDHYLFPYVEALYSNSKGGAFHEFVNPDKPATRNYLKYLINEYSQAN